MGYRQILFEGRYIRYFKKGKGFPLVFVHGNLLSSRVLGEFGEILASRYTLVAPDLPGHGLSDSYAPDHSMKFMAKAVTSVLQQEQIDKYILLGHSMGGYVSLVLLNEYPENIVSLVLLNSHPFADLPEKIRQRQRIISLIQKGKRVLYLYTAITEIFSTDVVDAGSIRKKAFESICRQVGESLIATVIGMRDRPDRSDLLKEPVCPVIWLAGLKDDQFSYKVLQREAEKRGINSPEPINTGHMSFREDPAGVFEAILSRLLKDFS